jgi:hypothetical protein
VPRYRSPAFRNFPISSRAPWLSPIHLSGWLNLRAEDGARRPMLADVVRGTSRRFSLDHAGRLILIKPSDNFVKDNLDGPPLRPPQCTFPNHQHTPIVLHEGGLRTAITLLVPKNLLAPELGPRAGPLEHGAVMSVPEAPMHKDRSAQTREHQIGTARQVLAVKPKSQSPCVQSTAQQQLGLCIPAAYAAHVKPSLVGCQDVDHGASGSIAGVCSPNDRRHFLHPQGG